MDVWDGDGTEQDEPSRISGPSEHSGFGGGSRPSNPVLFGPIVFVWICLGG